MPWPLASIFQILRPQEQDPKSLQQTNEPKWAKSLAKSFYKKTAKNHPVKSTFNQPPRTQNYTNLS